LAVQAVQVLRDTRAALVSRGQLVQVDLQAFLDFRALTDNKDNQVGQGHRACTERRDRRAKQVQPAIAATLGRPASLGQLV